MEYHEYHGSDNDTFKGYEVLDINVRVRGSYISHVDTIQHHWDHMVGQDLVELLSDVVLAQGVLQGEVELCRMSSYN